jgi:hypothetical protein
MNRREFLQLGSGQAVVACLGVASWGRQAGGQVIEPEQTDEVLVNPGMGFETFHSFNADGRIKRAAHYPKCSVAYFRFYWDKLEPQEGTYDFDLIDSLLEQARENKQDLALRFMPTSSADLSKGTPKWYMQKAKGYAYTKQGRKGWAPDHNDRRFLARQEELVGAWGERYNGHPNIIRMDIGSVGFWGEWHLSHTEPQVPMISEENAARVIDMYLRHWSRTPLSMLIGYVPGLRYAVSQGTGWRADSLGDYGHWSETWCHMFNAYPQKLAAADAHEAWKNGPVAFEPPGSMRDLERYVPSRGGGYDRMWSQALQWHGSAYNAKSGSIPAAQVSSIERFLKRCGYRLALRRLVAPRTLPAQQRRLPVTMEFENAGVAPPYRDYVLALRLTGGRDPVILPCRTQTSKWLPGRHQIAETLSLPEPLGAGEYALAIGLLEPTTRRPAVRLANKGADRNGWYPLGTVTVR